VEGWHTGGEWIDSGALLRRINFAADQMVKDNLPGIQSIIERMSRSETLDAEGLVDGCLDLMGPVQVEKQTRTELIDHVSKSEPANGNGGESRSFSDRVVGAMQIIASTREYQFG
jgi:hypothetical protein